MARLKYFTGFGFVSSIGYEFYKWKKLVFDAEASYLQKCGNGRRKDHRNIDSAFIGVQFLLDHQEYEHFPHSFLQLFLREEVI